MAHFEPESVAHFHPEQVAHFEPEYLVTGSGETVAGLTALTDPSVIASKLPLIQGQSILNSAHMTHQNFDPIYGLLKTTNPNGLQVSVEYDVFGRLHVTKDHNQNITSRTQYFYKP